MDVWIDREGDVVWTIGRMSTADADWDSFLEDARSSHRPIPNARWGEWLILY